MKYIVRGGDKKGKYLRLARRPVNGRKYSWTPYRKQAVVLTENQVRGIVRRYDGAEAYSL